MDLAKYRDLFLEEATEHLAEMGRALLELEKDPACEEAIDCVFRMAHSIKGMAASLSFEAITGVAHRLEDGMQTCRSEGRVPPEALGFLFQGLDRLERMIGVVRETGAEPETAVETPVGEPAAPADTRPVPPPLSIHAPPPSVRVRTEILDRLLSAVGEVSLSADQLRTRAGTSLPALPAEIADGFDRMDRVVGDLQRRALRLRTAPLLRVLEPLPRAARELAGRLDKSVEVDLVGAELELDRNILDRLSDPLIHLLRNAVDHGLETRARRRAAGKPETGRVVVTARREKDQVRISVEDDGAGLDLDAVRERAVAAGLVHADLAEDLPPSEIAALVFRPGLSTAASVSDVSGRGVGMDAVKATLESLSGRVEIRSRTGRGTTTSLLVPVAAALQRVLLLSIGGETVAVPIARVERIVEVETASIERSGRESFTLLDDEPVLVIELAERLSLASSASGDTVPLVLGEVRGQRVALRVDELQGQQEIYVKPVPDLLSGVRALAGLTVLGDGRPVFLLDLNQLV